ncbi:hypothetical protein [Botrimarina mediterranea]|uniref:IgA FC receptor n=1 Tax=Botrimarina mediterranea TaxID=2528022 RepID=A0A518K3N8_9BACT|nr:hypothetical protein [Botrimarina mediterranea]QDV72414.1 hypothetical protein Spa11_05890 [Botrimarina mediterranea]
MTLPFSRFALALALAATATLGVVAQTPDEPAVEAPAADAQQAVEAAADAPPTLETPAEPTPPAPAEAAPETSVPEAPTESVPLADEPLTEEPVAEVAEVTEPAAPVEEPVEQSPVEQSVVVTPAEPAAQPSAEPAPSVVVAEHAPAPAGPVCCPINVVDYRTTLSAKRAYRCYGPGVNTAVCVDNPADCTGAHYEVPLCVPACCTGAPRVCNARPGLLGRGKVDIVWDCGFTATVVFRAHGGAIVIYQG